jgi:hypothetical protein
MDSTGLVTWVTNLVLLPIALIIGLICLRYFLESRAAAIIGAIVIGIAVIGLIVDPNILVDMGRTAVGIFRGGGAETA